MTTWHGMEKYITSTAIITQFSRHAVFTLPSTSFIFSSTRESLSEICNSPAKFRNSAANLLSSNHTLTFTGLMNFANTSRNFFYLSRNKVIIIIYLSIIASLRFCNLFLSTAGRSNSGILSL